MKISCCSIIYFFLFIAVLLTPCLAVQNDSPKGQVKILGQDITKITFTKIGIVNTVESEADFTIGIENPDEIIELSAGKYSINRVELKGGYYASSYIPIIVSEDEVTELKAGGPLTQAITAQKLGRNLQLSYVLTGIGGERYIDSLRKETPGFTIHKAGKIVDSGHFEYG